MKRFYYISSMAAALLTASALFMGACTDDWDSHYDGEGLETAADQPTLLALVQQDAELKPFLRVLERTGYDKVLGSPQALTLWAPVITDAEADSVIALYQQQKQSVITMPDGTQRYIQDKDNNAITQFVQNHIALFGRSVSKEYNDTVRMMNGKYMILQHDNLNSVPFLQKNIVACNGIYYKIGSKLTFFANVRDYLEMHPDLTSVGDFFKLFDSYDLDAASSVQRGIVDGKIVYADSVLRLSNTLHGLLGWINREDSSYLFVAPSNEVWDREYEQFLPYFTYVNAVENRDSVADLNAKFAIIRGRFFNLNDQRSAQDSLVNTLHMNSSSYYGLNIFERPYAAGGLLAGLTPWNCSNGQVCIDNEGRVDPANTFLEARYVLASDPSIRRTPMLTVSSASQPQVTVLNRSVVDTITYNGVKYDFHELQNKNFMEMRPATYTGVTNVNSSMYFFLTNTYSNVFYNVYLVTVPAYASADGYAASEVLPTRFQVFYNERLMTNRTSTTTNPNDDESFAIPTQDRALSVPDGETHRNGNNYFQTSGDQVDVICIDRARQTTVSSYNVFGSNNQPVMRYRVTSAVRSPDLNNGIQTNVMRINRLIYIPFATKEEAEAYELDLSNLKEYNIHL